MTRQRKTPRQRAEETLAAAERRAQRLGDQVERARTDLEALERDLAEAELRLDYAHQDPALQGSSTTPSTTNQAGDTTA